MLTATRDKLGSIEIRALCREQIPTPSNQDIPKRLQFTVDENFEQYVRKAIRLMKSGKACGKDLVLTEAFELPR